MMPMPELWRCFGQACGLSESQARDWWYALTRARQAGLAAPCLTRPKPLVLSEAQQKELAALSPTARLTRYREMQTQEGNDAA